MKYFFRSCDFQGSIDTHGVMSIIHLNEVYVFPHWQHMIDHKDNFSTFFFFSSPKIIPVKK